MKGTVLKSLLLIVTGLVVGTICTRLIGKPLDRARLLREGSAESALFTEAKCMLADYKAKHGNYPASLTELPLTFPDGGDKDTLGRIIYTRCASGYVIGCRFSWGVRCN